MLVLGLSHTPTLDYYVTSRRKQDSSVSGPVLLGDEVGQLPADLPNEVVRVVVRHAPLRWAHRVRQGRGACVLLMDDDLPLAWRAPDVPRLYGLRTSWRYYTLRSLLGSDRVRLWVSTSELQRRYPGARLVPPRWFDPMPTRAPDDCLRWGYHGSPVHHREPAWLVPVVEQVQRRVSGAVFEIFGGRRTERLFSGIPRVEVLPPRNWPDYLAYARTHPLAVGVAPLLPGPFNAARSHTKAFDILRTGAVGVFLAREPYVSAMQGSGGVLLGDDPAEWVDAVARLLTDSGERAERFAQGLQWLEGQVARPGELQALLSDAT